MIDLIKNFPRRPFLETFGFNRQGGNLGGRGAHFQSIEKLKVCKSLRNLEGAGRRYLSVQQETVTSWEGSEFAENMFVYCVEILCIRP